MFKAPKKSWGERTNLLQKNKPDDDAVVSAVAKDIATEIKKEQKAGLLTFKTLGFLGGIAMVVSNSLVLVNDFFSLAVSRAIISFYLILFGVLIFCLDAPGKYTQKLREEVRLYVKVLSYTWGRGILYIFCGTLQVSNPEVIDLGVGGFMIVIGVLALFVSQGAATQMKLVQNSIKSEKDLKEKWNRSDADGNGVLDVKELTNFCKEAGVEMSRNQMAAFFIAVDRDFDEKINYEEFLNWWKSRVGRGGTV